jgi:HSP20 family molecular chaperone IbpA
MPSRSLETRMWAEACEMIARAEQLQRQFFHPPERHAAIAAWEPPVDLLEAGPDLWIVAALPGVPAKQLEVTIEGGAVVIEGERILPRELQGASIRRLEIPHGRFRRVVRLPEGRYLLGQRKLVDGCLTLTLRRV